jgi:hypothetical protein
MGMRERGMEGWKEGRKRRRRQRPMPYKCICIIRASCEDRIVHLESFGARRNVASCVLLLTHCSLLRGERHERDSVSTCAIAMQ